MKITPELLQATPSTANPLKERQLDLRGELYRNTYYARDFIITTLFSQDIKYQLLKTLVSQGYVTTLHHENYSKIQIFMIYSKDQHDAIDLTDNSIIVLGNIPLLRRLRTLLLANNRISSISPSLHLSVPNLTTLVLTNNNITELGDLEPLKEMKNLKYLSLMGNPVREKKWYREWLAYRIPGLRVLDFQRIRDKVRYYPHLIQ